MATRLASYPITQSRRRHDRVDLSRQQVEAWLVLERGNHLEPDYCCCQLLNLSYSGMCLQAEDLFEAGKRYRFILDLAAMLGAEAEVTVRIVWKRQIDAGLCYAGAVFVESSAPWLGPNEDDESCSEERDCGGGNG